MIGRSLAHYRITAKLGEGGMGEVYRATDSKLDREVAIKILPGSFAADPERLGRFEREAKVLASLNHPSIAAIYGVEQEDGVRALVLELVDGPTLAERLAAGRLERDEALRIACRIAEALEEAHERGIVHRDLKPANVKLASAGKVKVLDFGLAKALDPMAGRDSAPSLLAHSPTLTLGATMQGVILGTAAYMSPEQARGAATDARADVWAFGVVLFEMLAGRSLFTGPTVSDTLASVLKVEPDLALLPGDTPRKLRRLLERCLRKDARERLHSIADARIVIEEVLRGELDEAPATAAAAAPARPRWQVAAALGGALAAGAAVTLGVAALLEPPPVPPRVLRFDLAPPAELDSLGAPKISPDGRHVAFVARDEKATNRVWIRSLDAPEARSLSGSDGVAPVGRPFWSPDSRFVAFFTGDKLLKAPVGGGPPVKIADARGADGSWGDGDLIAYDGAPNTPIFAVSAGGGVPRELIGFVDGEDGYQVAWPQFLPGGERLLYVIFRGSEERNGIWLAAADGSGARRVVPGLSRVEFVPPNWLLFVRDATLVAQRLDPVAGELTGEPIPIVDGLGVTNVGLAEFSAAHEDVLAFRANGAIQSQLAFYDAQGKREADPAAAGEVNNPTFSPDGRWLAYDAAGPRGDRDIWLRDLRRGVATRVTTAAENEAAPLFSHDGERLVFNRTTNGGWQIVARPLGQGGESVLVERKFGSAPTSVSPDGRWLVFVEFPRGQGELHVLDLAGGVEPRQLTDTAEFSESRATLSPDGRWLALQSNESGAPEVYVQPFPGPGRRWQISTGGGVFPFWAPDGSCIYYRDGEDRLVRVAVQAGASFDAQLPEPLFDLPLAAGNSNRRIAVSPDGKRFVATVPAGSGAEVPTSIFIGWRSLLPR